MQPYFSVDDLHEQERAAGKRRTDEERDLVTELHPQPAAERGHALTVRDFELHMPAMDAYYEAEYLRDGDFWCSHEGSTAIWLYQYRYVCHLAGIGHDAEGMAAAVNEAYRRAASWEVYADVAGCLRALKERGLALGVVSNWDASAS